MTDKCSGACRGSSPRMQRFIQLDNRMFVELFRAARKRRKMSIAQVAVKAGLSDRTMYEWSGRKAIPNAALDMTPDQFLGIEKEPSITWYSTRCRLPWPMVSVLLYIPELKPLPTVHEGYFVPAIKKGEKPTFAVAPFGDRIPFQSVKMWAMMPEGRNGENRVD